MPVSDLSKRQVSSEEQHELALYQSVTTSFDGNVKKSIDAGKGKLFRALSVLFSDNKINLV